MFDEVAEDYDRHRPSYPDVLVDEACEAAGIGPGSGVLEIGCGTGQLTRSLLARELRVTAVEPGAQLLARARDQLDSAGDVRFVNARLEDALLPAARYDAVFSASAIHWVDPDVSWRKVADALVDGGSLALLSYFGLEEPGSVSDQQALGAALARIAPELPPTGPPTETLKVPSRALRLGGTTSRRCGRGLGVTRLRARTPRTCLMRCTSQRSRSCWSTPPTSSTPCWARCHSGHDCQLDSETI